MACSVGSRSCIESLKSDLRSSQSGLKEVLLACTKRESLQVPSWRFPERLAASLDTDEMLRDLAYSSGSEDMNCSTHVLLLELVVDRWTTYIITIHVGGSGVQVNIIACKVMEKVSGHISSRPQHLAFYGECMCMHICIPTFIF